MSNLSPQYTSAPFIANYTCIKSKPFYSYLKRNCAGWSQYKYKNQISALEKVATNFMRKRLFNY